MSNNSPIDPAALATASDGFTQLLELAVGYREQCIAKGFSPTAAEHMAMQLHTELISMALRSVS